MIMSFFLTTFFCQNLRSLLIMPEMEAPIENYYKDIHYDIMNIALDNGNA